MPSRKLARAVAFPKGEVGAGIREFPFPVSSCDCCPISLLI